MFARNVLNRSVVNRSVVSRQGRRDVALLELLVTVNNYKEAMFRLDLNI